MGALTIPAGLHAPTGTPRWLRAVKALERNRAAAVLMGLSTAWKNSFCQYLEHRQGVGSAALIRQAPELFGFAELTICLGQAQGCFDFNLAGAIRGHPTAPDTSAGAHSTAMMFNLAMEFPGAPRDYFEESGWRELILMNDRNSLFLVHPVSDCASPCPGDPEAFLVRHGFTVTRRNDVVLAADLNVHGDLRSRIPAQLPVCR